MCSEYSDDDGSKILNGDLGYSQANKILEEPTIEIAIHSALIRNLIKLKGTTKLTVPGEQVYLKDSKYILFEILAHRTCKSSCQPSKPNLAI